MRIRWPDISNSSASLVIQTGNDFSQEISFGGAWGFLKLLKAARINKVTDMVLNAKWQINVQNMYMIYFDSRIQISGSDHPFSDPVFADFICPLNILTDNN